MNKVLLVGYGNQGKKREKVEFNKIIGTVDPKINTANYRKVQEVPLSKFDIAYLCCPDNQKGEILKYLVKNKKHVLVEKPLFPIKEKSLLFKSNDFNLCIVVIVPKLFFSNISASKDNFS